MANSSRQTGLRPINPVIRANIYKYATGNAIFMYQPVTLLNTGLAGQALVDGTSAGGQALLGSVIGFLAGDWSPVDNDQSGYIPANPDANQLDSNGNVNVLVADSPDQLFVIEEDTGGSALTLASVGAGGVMTTQGIGAAATSGNTISGVSNAVLDRSLVGAGAGSNLTLQLIKLWDKPDNAYGDYAKWIVRINDHQYQRASDATSNQGEII